METAGDIIQDLCQSMNISDIQSSCEFKQEMEDFKKTLQAVEKFKEARLHITGEIAEAVQNVKMFIVKGEHGRMLNDM